MEESHRLSTLNKKNYEDVKKRYCVRIAPLFLFVFTQRHRPYILFGLPRNNSAAR